MGVRPVRPVAQFALTGLAVVLVLGFIAVAALRKVGTREAIRDARQETRLAAAAVITPALPGDLPHASAAELARFDAVVRRSVLVEPVVRVKVWAADGFKASAFTLKPPAGRVMAAVATL